jgi:hypothetical protein
MLIAGCSYLNKQNNPLPKKSQLSEIKNNVKFQMGPIKSNAQSVFVDMASEYGLKDVKAVHLYAVDFDNDGYTDLVILEDFYSVPKFYKFEPKLKKFLLIKSPFEENIRASYLNFVDLNHDGIYDVIVGTLNQRTEMTKSPVRIFKGILNSGEYFFSEMEKPINKAYPTANVSVLDFDLDGYLDLFFANWYDQSTQNPTIVGNKLFKGDGVKFLDSSNLLTAEYDVNRSSKSNLNFAPTFGASICDVDRNGFPDILTNSSNGFYNKLWLNLEKNNERYFEDYGERSGYAADNEGRKELNEGGNSFFSLCGDYNNDGIVDVLIGNLFRETDPETKDRSSFLTGASPKFPPKFIRTEFYSNENYVTHSEGERRGVFIDYNLDGLQDVIVDNSGFPPDSRLFFLEQSENHEYVDQGSKLGVNILNPSGTITIDVNRDGVMDFITGQSDVRAKDQDNRIYLFVNQTKRNHKGSLLLHLKGKKANYHGIGSSISLITNRHRYWQNVSYNFGSLPSQNEEGIYFAFGDEIPKKLIVTWPYAISDRLGRKIPLTKEYDLSKFKLSKIHKEFNVCEDGLLKKLKEQCQ